MKVVLLCGGLGTRISEESHLRPKPMIEIGDKPILWHIMKIFSAYGFTEFILCLGYKGYMIKEYFANYFLHNSDVTMDLATNTLDIHRSSTEPWKVTLVDTGLSTATGGRIKRIQKYVGNDTFLLTYGDGVGDINITKLVEYHRKNNKYATITAVQPPGRFGALALTDDCTVTSFQEKPRGDSAWINGGFFVLEPAIFDYIADDDMLWEKEPLSMLASEGQLQAYRHFGYWKPMDTLRDRTALEERWQSGQAEWKIW